MVQDPLTALYPSMPLHAIRDVDVDHVVRLEEMAVLLSQLAATERPGSQEVTESMTQTRTKLTCPEAGGRSRKSGRVGSLNSVVAWDMSSPNSALCMNMT